MKINELEFTAPAPVGFLNSASNDLYPVFNDDRSIMFFCSDRNNGQFNIFEVDIDITNNSITDILDNNIAGDPVLNSTLSGEFNDKCPFIFENILIFASDRPGGFGGYDLYYSLFENGVWTDPVNFGGKINTEKDEYRPILIQDMVSGEQTMMVFSSDRDGGLGGFDLYYVGIDYQSERWY